MSSITQAHSPRRIARLGAALAGALPLAAAMSIAAPERSGASIAVPPADLAVSLSASSSLLLTDTVDYDLAVTDEGVFPLGSGTVVVQFPSQVTGVTGDCSFDASTDRSTCAIGSLQVGETRHLSFRARYAPSLGLSLRATATRTASTPYDDNPANDRDSATCTVVAPIAIVC